MKKTLTLFALAAVLAAPSFGAYVIVLKNGGRYVAKQKWTVVNGKALIVLESGQTMQVDPALIDVPKSEQATKMGLGANANVIDGGSNQPQPARGPSEPSLGSQIKLRPRNAKPQAEEPAPKPVATASASVPARAIENFERAYENLSIYEHKIESTGARSLRAELTVDTEERVFNAISATSYLIVRNAGVGGVQIDVVDLFMKTTTGGAAGRFHMTRADAEALDKRTMSQQDYFVRNVIY